MTTESNSPQESTFSVLEVLRKIQVGAFNPRQLKPEDRQLCVQHLGAEGYSVFEISKLLKVHERTIARDREAIQKRHALKHDPELAGRVAGQFVFEVETAIHRIRRAARDKDVPAAVKIEAERACVEVRDRAIQRLQSLGYLPTATRRVEADLTHRLEAQASLDELSEEVARLQEIQSAGLLDAAPADDDAAAPSDGTEEGGAP